PSRPGVSRRTPGYAVPGLAVLALVLAGCGGSNTSDPASATSSDDGSGSAAAGYPVTVDNCGTEVTFDQAPERVVTIKSTSTELLLALGLEDYDEQRINGAELPISDLERTCRELTAMTREQRDALGVMHPGRGDVIGGGALVWRRVLQRIAEATDGRVSTATTSEHDILDGIALSRLSTIPQKAPLA
ncbi:MAG: hypothetical protein L0G19_05930, partial [Micrococcales bacterium]|nr:hypothetical protein [Micrococcales bacterium]